MHQNIFSRTFGLENNSSCPCGVDKRGNFYAFQSSLKTILEKFTNL